MGLHMRVALACFLAVLVICAAQAGLGEASAEASVKPTHSFDSYDLYQVGMTVEEQQTEGVEKKAMKTKSPEAMEEYAVCKAGAGACAASRLSCPAACVQSFYHGYGGGGYGRGYGGGGYGRGYGGGGYGRGGYGRGYGGGGYGRGYGGGRYGGGGGGGGGGYGGGGGGGGGGGWASACKYDCASACKATC